MRRSLKFGALATAILVPATMLSIGGPAVALPPAPVFEEVGNYDTGLALNDGNTTASESVAIWNERLYVTNASDNSMDIVDWSNPASPSLELRVDLAPYGAGPNSVAAGPSGVVVAVEASPRTDPGSLVLFEHDGTYVDEVPTGALPDMVAMRRDGRVALVANEGEPSADYAIDPEGSVTIVKVDEYFDGGPVPSNAVRTVNFDNYATPADLPAGVRIFGPGASPAQDIEPEYITLAGGYAYVSLQENNAMARINLAGWRRIAPEPEVTALGLKDHSLAGNGLDPSDKDSATAIASWPVMGMYMPDAIAAYRVDGQTHIFSANEGDARAYDTYTEEARVKNLTLDPTVFPTAAALKTDPQLGRLNVTNTGDSDDDGDQDQILAFGTRSFSVWDASAGWGAGSVPVWDSGDDIEQITAAAYPANFNANSTSNTADDRSDNKGPEPEGIAIGRVGRRPLAFVGLERIGGVLVYDITDPGAPVFLQYLNTRDFALTPGGDLGAEVLAFVGPKGSANGVATLVLANEVSGTVTLLQPVGAPV